MKCDSFCDIHESFDWLQLEKPRTFFEMTI